MERRRIGFGLAGLLVLVSSLFLLAGTASAARKPAAEEGSELACKVTTEPGSFIAQGEFGTNSSIADVIEVECNPELSESIVTLSSEELYSRCQGDLYWADPYEFAELEEGVEAARGLKKGKRTKSKKNEAVDGPNFQVELDDDGNATAVVWGGPSCAAGQSLVSAHLVEAPYDTFTTSFTVDAPKPTATGVEVFPKSEVEDDFTSSVASIVNVEFPSVYAEHYVNINAAQLYDRCLVPPYLTFIGPDGEYYGSGEEISGVQLDNDGSAFLVMIGSASCASGPSEIDASLEAKPYTTVSTEFTILPPQPTED
jgi:hypothetical protein